MKNTTPNMRLAAMLADGRAIGSLNSFQLISGGRNSFEHLLLTSSSAILFGFSSGRTNIKYQHSSKPDALAARHAALCNSDKPK